MPLGYLLWMMSTEYPRLLPILRDRGPAPSGVGKGYDAKRHWPTNPRAPSRVAPIPQRCEILVPLRSWHCAETGSSVPLRA